MCGNLQIRVRSRPRTLIGFSSGVEFDARVNNFSELTSGCVRNGSYPRAFHTSSRTRSLCDHTLKTRDLTQ